MDSLMSEVPAYFRYWGKAKRDAVQPEPDYHLLAYHSLDVAAVGELWWEKSRSIRHSFTQITDLSERDTKSWVLFFIALHDYGKWDIRFQRKAPAVLKAVNPDLARLNLSLSENEIHSYYHGPEGLAWFFHDNEERFSVDDWMDDSSEDWGFWSAWFAAVAGHHGHIPDNQVETAVLPISCKPLEPQFKAARLSWLKALEALFLQPAGLSLSNNPPVLEKKEQIMLAGFCSICDWLGSSDFFPYDIEYQVTQQKLKRWYEGRSKFAETALTSSGLISHTRPNPSIDKLLKKGQAARQVQCLIEKLPYEQSLTLIEASTGSGKTEAALAYAWKLLNQGLADSIIFALPTQATANAMFERLEKAAENIFQEETNLVLAHGRSKYQESFINLQQASKLKSFQGEEEAWVQCGEWIAQSRKRIFLGQIGVCTVDQVLVSVLPIRHKFVRGFGIGRSVLVVDEVHAYDNYMYGLLNGVLQQQKAAGGSAILLSATLPAHQKQSLATAWECQLDDEVNDRYPLITNCFQNSTQTFDLESYPHHQPPIQYVDIELFSDESLLPNKELLQRIEQAVFNGAQVCIVCNLVDVAQNLYQLIAQQFDDNTELDQEQISLFHSRFTFNDRKVKEQTVLDTFGLETNPKNVRDKGHLLIATQVVEQSLDIDFDWLITQLCPVDLLFQRMGRLHRHERKRPKGFEKRLCTVLAPDSLDYQLHELIYGNSRVLWRTHQLLEKALKKSSQIEFPTAYREWIEPVYQEDEWVGEPEVIKVSYEKYEEMAYASSCNAKQLMNSSMNPMKDDDAKVSLLTRDGEMSLSLVPYTINSDGNRCLLDGKVEKGLDKAERFEAINLNTTPIPQSWGRTSDRLPESDDHGLIWLEMQMKQHGYSCNFGFWRYDYSHETGFHRMEKDKKDSE
jgi:CRISPR-associated endonuclease/helicase Cas3